MDSLKVYLCDPTHDTVVLVSDTIPINIGYVASYADKVFGKDIDMRLFKYPNTIIEAIRHNPPDVLALSNYSWNSNLSERLASLAKRMNPNVVTVQGGTNFPHESAEHGRFLSSRPNTDFHIELEGEKAFSELLKRILDVDGSRKYLFDQPVNGCVFIQPGTSSNVSPMVVSGDKPDRIRELDEIPSPYLNGFLDHFFDGRLTPFIETNRGCPFKCSFCHTGNDYFQKTNTFSIERVQEEISFIAPRAAAEGIVNLHIADTNFGMYPRDRSICEVLKKTHDEYGWPLQIMATTGKNNKERVIDITSIMGNIFSVNMSVQSMDKQVLANIKRDNIKLEDYVKINAHLNEEGRSTKGELILGMPGETKGTFLNGLEQLIESGVSSVCVYTLMLLKGTEFQQVSYRQKFGMVGKYRIVPLNFGEYDGNRVLDYEEVCVQTNDMSFEDYLYIRGFALLVEALHNGRPFEEFFRFALSMGVSRTQLLHKIYDNLPNSPDDIKQLVSNFLQETREELWTSEGELESFYDDDLNYQKLINGEIGGNLIYKYKSISLVFAAQSWITTLGSICKDLSREKFQSEQQLDKAINQIDYLVKFCSSRLAGLLDVKGNVDTVIQEIPYDVVSWLKAQPGCLLESFAVTSPLRYEFYYTSEQLLARSDQFKRYGTDANALSKIVTRISSIESITRKVRTPFGEEPIYTDPDADRFTRYMMAG